MSIRIDEILSKYDLEDLSVATLGSHSALQILHGAKLEGFRTIAICSKGRTRIYERFGVADEILVLDRFSDVVRDNVQARLIERNAILVPHGSLIAYVGLDDILEKLRIPIFGNRYCFRIEHDRNLEARLFELAGVRTPRRFSSPDEIDGLVIVKFPGAKGGKGYFLARSREEFERKLERLSRIYPDLEKDKAFIQEYIIGVPFYFQYFYSPINDELEIFGIDRRYETNADALGRIPPEIREDLEIEPTYLVVGNIPLVIRESLLEEVLDIGERVLEASRKLAPPGLIGPFCLESAITDDGSIYLFEISVRIVAGTNLYSMGSPYSFIKFNEPMSMGRRIARELKIARDRGELERILT